MSKQLTLSATAAVLSMAAFALVASFGAIAPDRSDQLAGSAPLTGISATR